MLIVVPGAVRLPKKQFSHIKLPCRCSEGILCHSGIFDNGIDYSIYECMGCGLTMTVNEYWGMEFGPVITVGEIAVGTTTEVRPPYYTLSRQVGKT